LFAFLLVVALHLGPALVQPQEECASWQECRDKALAAAAREDFEQFHDLAWRAFRKGPKNDASLMTMLARAQSMSGRPHDALVMLQRLAALGVVTDAAASEDFRRVRALPGWSDLQARIAGVPAAATTPDARVAPSTGAPAPAVPRAAAPPNPASPPPAVSPAKATPAETAGGDATEALRFTTESFVPAGLAYDSVSNRFIVADRRERKLSVVGERSQRMSNLIGAESGGFGDIGGIAVDRREGDLWVASTAGAAAKLHKLQLISGRVLWSAGVADGVPPATFGDLALTPSSDVLALDVVGRRIFRLKHQGSANRQLEVVVPLEAKSPASIAPASDTVVYIAHDDGISRADLSSQHVRAIKAPAGVDLTGLAWIRWHRGHLLGAQRGPNGTYDIVRIRLDGGGSNATRIDFLERGVSVAGPSSVALAGNTLYYLTIVPGSSESAQFVVRKIQIN
jgi:hypothetical protein